MSERNEPMAAKKYGFSFCLFNCATESTIVIRDWGFKVFCNLSSKSKAVA